jgi:CubicO group peptidase (beta-lactamase class C family)
MMLNGGVLDGSEIFKPEIWELMTTNQVPGHIDTPRSCGWVVYNEESFITPMNIPPENSCFGHSGYTGTIIWMDKFSKAYVIMFTNCVYPIDKQSNKDEIIRTRKSVIRTVLDHLKVYEEYKSGEKV